MKLAVRATVFAAGVLLLFFSWRHAHTAAVANTQGTTSTGSPAEVLVVIGTFLALMAFAPTPDTLGRWMALKRRRRPQPAHFKRRRLRS